MQSKRVLTVHNLPAFLFKGGHFVTTNVKYIVFLPKIFGIFDNLSFDCNRENTVWGGGESDAAAKRRKNCLG